MHLRIPDYYEAFHCIASECKHNCCAANWEIDVDEETYQYYCGLQTEFGEKLRASIEKDKQIHFKLKHGKCPFLSKGHLCEVYQTLGEKSLCKVCTVYPRFEEKYGDMQEKILGLSCEEAARIVFTHPEPVHFFEREVAASTEMVKSKEEKIEKYDRHQIEKARDEAIAILQDRSLPLKERFYLFLVFCHEVQQCMSENQIGCVDTIINKYKTNDAKQIIGGQKISNMPVHTLFMNRMNIMMDMDIVEEEWGEAMNNVMRVFYADSLNTRYTEMAMKLDYAYPEDSYQYEHLMVYFADQYLMQAIYDGDFWGYAQYSLLGYLTIHDMDIMKFFIQGEHFSLEDRIESVRLYCKQVEHSAQSEKYLKEKIVTEPVFSLEALLKQINNSNE